MTDADEWIEVSCSLFPGADGAAHIPWQALAEARDEWAARGLLQGLWFVRKMPGLKLRLRGGSRQAELEVELARWLAEAERRNDLRGFRFTRYEPERHRFGGDAGLAIAHRHFEVGSGLVLEHQAAQSAGRPRLSPLVWSVVNTSDLLLRALPDAAEVWDVWCSLQALLPTQDEEPHMPDAVAAGGWSALWQQDPGAEDRTSMQVSREANDASACNLVALAAAGRLGVGLRHWLSAVTTFEWNRWGLPNDLQALTRAVDAAARQSRPQAV
jgi:thiopeptide-type bacteriocin biosynthesis protein